MALSVLALVERIRAATAADQDADWFTRGANAYEKKQYLKALDAWKLASVQGDMESSYRIGLLYARGEGVVRSLPDAVSWYRRAAAGGHTGAQYELGLIYLNGADGAATGLDHWFGAISEQNLEAAQQTLNMLFPNGIAVEKDLDEARRWIWAAAAAGKVQAQATLGEMYRQGLGVSQDYQEAHRWYWLAAQQGIASAQFAMGDLYYQGLGLAIDHHRAADWYDMAATNGDARAQVALASMYRAGQGRPADLQEAGRLFVQAAEQGEARGLYHAALMLLKGEGLPKNADKAETYLRKSAKQGYLPAIIGVAQFYAHGNGIEPDLREAAVWYVKAAELGDVQSQFIVGRLYATGSGVPNNLRESAKWFLRAAEQGNPTAAHNVASYYANGTGVKRDIDKALEWYRAAANAGVAASQVQLGKMYSAGHGVPLDRKTAADWLERAAQSGDPEAKTALAMLHLQHEGEGRDSARAEQLLKEAAGQGHAAAAVQLGHLYSGKYAVELKSGDAVHWYTKAAEAGTLEAQHTLGVLYLSGRGVPKNLGAAASWIEKSAQNGYAPSQFQLAVLHCTAQGVPRDLPCAVSWYERAAEQGHPLAQYNLAVMLSKGQGCDADETRAESWFRKAAGQNVPEAKRALADLRRAGRVPTSEQDLAPGEKISTDSSSSPSQEIAQAAAPPSPPAIQKTSSEVPASSSAIERSGSSSKDTLPSETLPHEWTSYSPVSRNRSEFPVSRIGPSRNENRLEGRNANVVGSRRPFASESDRPVGERDHSDEMNTFSKGAGGLDASATDGASPQNKSDRGSVERCEQFSRSAGPAEAVGKLVAPITSISPTSQLPGDPISQGPGTTNSIASSSLNAMSGVSGLKIISPTKEPTVAKTPLAPVTHSENARRQQKHPDRTPGDTKSTSAEILTAKPATEVPIANSLDDDLTARTPGSNVATATSNSTANAAQESIAHERAHPEIQEGSVKAMSDLARELQTLEETDEVPRFQNIATEKEHQSAGQATSPTNLKGCTRLTATAPSSEGPARPCVTLASADAAFKELTRAMAELGVHAEGTNVSASALSNKQPSACEMDNSAPARRTDELSSPLYGALAECVETTTITSSTRGIGERKPQRYAGNDQLKSYEAPSTGVQDFDDASAELVQTATGVNRVASESTIDLPSVPKNADKSSISALELTVSRPATSNAETNLDRRAGRPTLSAEAHSNWSRSINQGKSGQVADPFLDDLSRRLDTIQLFARRYPKC